MCARHASNSQNLFSLFVVRYDEHAPMANSCSPLLAERVLDFLVRVTPITAAALCVIRHLIGMNASQKRTLVVTTTVQIIGYHG